MTDREPITKRLPRVGRARDLDVEFLELFADITACLTALRIAITAHPEFTPRAAAILKEREEVVVNRFERLLADLGKGNNNG